jgi:hypothetical protein
MSIHLKVICYAALMGIWGLFAFVGKTDVAGFIGAITAALAALGAIHAGSSSAPAAPPKDTP